MNFEIEYIKDTRKIKVKQNEKVRFFFVLSLIRTILAAATATVDGCQKT